MGRLSQMELAREELPYERVHVQRTLFNNLLTREWYTAERDGDALVMTDMRYGTGTKWRDGSAQRWFAICLVYADDNLLVERIPCGSDFTESGERWHALLGRTLAD